MKKNSTDLLQRKPVERSSRTFIKKLLIHVPTNPIEKRSFSTSAHITGKGLVIFLLPLHDGSSYTEIAAVDDASLIQTADDIAFQCQTLICILPDSQQLLLMLRSQQCRNKLLNPGMIILRVHPAASVWSDYSRCRKYLHRRPYSDTAPTRVSISPYPDAST